MFENWAKQQRVNNQMPELQPARHGLAARDHVLIYLNGKRYVVRGDEASMSLAQWLREVRGKVGTKIVCNEGDCGACSVLVGKPNIEGSIRYRAIDSCIAFLFQLDRSHVVTVEGLSVDRTLSPIQDAMVKCHGSQCGFCTPGFVTTMHGMVEASQPLDDESLRYGLSGNLCRCTGYVQILNAGKSVDAASVARLAEIYPDARIVNDFVAMQNDSLAINANGRTVFVPATIEEAITIRAVKPTATIVSGATDYGVLHNHGRCETNDLLCLSNIRHLRDIAVHDGVLSIGALATWIDIEAKVKTLLPAYHEILTHFGSPQIREMGTIGGNIASGSPIADSVPVHLVLDSEIELIGASGSRTVPMRDFYLGYRNTAMRPDELIAAIHTPLVKSDERLTLYKISKRLDMDISTLTFAIWAKIDGDNIIDARLALGGVGPTVMRITKAEQAMIGKSWSEATFQIASKIAREEVSPWTDVRGSANYRSLMTEKLVLKSFYEHAELAE